MTYFLWLMSIYPWDDLALCFGVIGTAYAFYWCMYRA